jgi:homospermidine synthase
MATEIESNSVDLYKSKISEFNKNRRLNILNQMIQNKRQFNKKIFMFGFGAIGKPILYMILKLTSVNPHNVFVIAKEEKIRGTSYFSPLGVNFMPNSKLDKNSYRTLLSNAQQNDIIVDCAYDISTQDMINFCQEKGCHYINSCIEWWNYKDVNDPLKYSLYYKHEELEQLNKSFVRKNFNAIISMGCNPGNVSIWTKIGIEKIAKEMGINISGLTHGEIAKKIGVQVIHISERDTQATTKPRRPYEYCNTWSSDGEAFYEEALGCVEASWGTHEVVSQADNLLRDKPLQFAILNRLGINTIAQSVVSGYGRYFGYVIRHDESNTIGKHLQLVSKETGKITYKPSVYYVYHPADAAKKSIEELKEKEFVYQKNWRLLTDDLTENGQDILGLTFYLENKDVYWIGSMLDTKEARELYNNEFNKYINATNVQVVGGYLSGILHIMDLINENKNNGIMFPEDLPHNKIWSLGEPFFGDFVFEKIENFSLVKYKKHFNEENIYTNDWQFDNFLV